MLTPDVGRAEDPAVAVVPNLKPPDSPKLGTIALKKKVNQ